MCNSFDMGDVLIGGAPTGMGVTLLCLVLYNIYIAVSNKFNVNEI